jgi:RimJ/RimL family protein N-acetyltransferase
MATSYGWGAYHCKLSFVDVGLMNIEALIRLQLELECIRINERGYVQQFPCNNPDAAARLYVMYDGQHYHRYIRHDVPTEMRQLLKLMAGATLFAEHERVRGVLLEDAPCEDVFIGKTYIFPEAIAVPDDAQIVFHKEGHLCAIVVNGVVVSSCSSVRENDHAAEAWVLTDEAYRNRGYGLCVVQAWAKRIRAAHKVPFYSHHIQNTASQRLAETAGMQWVFDIVAYS